MLDRPDFAALVAGQTAVLEMINSGADRLPVLNQLLRNAQHTLGAAGMSFAEHGAAGGRIVAATGAAQWALGRVIDDRSGDLPPGERTLDIRIDSLSGELADQFGGQGVVRMLVAPAAIDGTVIGVLHAHYPVTAPAAGSEHHLVMAYLAAFVAGWYGGRCEPRLIPPQPYPPGRYRHESDHDLFVAVASHELRTPVTVIKGYAETLHEHWDSLSETDRRQAARVIAQRATDLARLVERLLSTANELGPTGAPPAPFDLVEALQSAVAELPDHLRERVVLELPAELPKVVGDRPSVPTVLTELVTNAAKYSDGPVELTATVDGNEVVFRVSDRGVGIRPEDVERAFDRFWQGESSDQRRNPGVGLGLYLVRKIIERQNGAVSLRPRERGGTVAEVRLTRG